MRPLLGKPTRICLLSETAPLSTPPFTTPDGDSEEEEGEEQHFVQTRREEREGATAGSNGSIGDER